LSRMAEHERDSRAQRGDLRQGQIDKDHFTGQHLNAEIGVDADQADRHQERRPEGLQRIAHRVGDAAVRALASASHSEKEYSVRGRAPTEAASVTTCAPALLATKATSRSGSLGSRMMMRAPFVRMSRTMPARCDGLGGTPGLFSMKPTKS